MGRLVLLITLFICSINIAFTQDWQTFNSNTSYAFGEHFVVYDSIKGRGQDTLLYNFKNIRKVREYEGGFNETPYSAVAPSWLGSVVVIKPSGQNVFLNGDNDSVYIETKARKGTSFTIYKNIAKNLEITGRVDSVVFKQFLGVQDSLKYITLITNGHTGFGTEYDTITSLVLSKQYGLVESLAFLKVGYTIIDIPESHEVRNKNTLSGNTGITGTFKVLQIADLFDFNVGDEFHTEKRDIYPPNYFDEVKRIEKVIAKSYSINNDTLIYTVDVCQLRRDPHRNLTIQKTHSIEVSKIALYESVPYINAVPGKSYFVNGELQSVSSQSGKTKTMRGGHYLVSCMKPDSCSDILDLDSRPDDYIQGFGGPYYDYNSVWGGYESRKLVYSKKSGIEKGTPYVCEDLLTTITDEELKSKLRIYPNPATEHVSLEATESGLLTISSVLGEELYKTPFNNGITTVSLNSLPAGIFIITSVTSADRFSEKLIIQK